MDSLAPGLALGASGALLVILLGAIFRVVQLVFKTQRTCEAECAELRAQNAWERQGKDAMIHACQSAKPPVPIPRIVFQRPTVGVVHDDA